MTEWSPPRRFDDYELHYELGRGAMGEVHLGVDLQLQREVAIKFIRRSDEFGDTAQQRFLVEARAIARLQGHPNVVTVHRVGQVGGHLYLVSEYVRGTALDQLTTPVDFAQAFEIALDIASGLAAAHRAQVVHRDVKPANAIRTEDGRVKLLDFGIAKLVMGEEPLLAPTPAPERPLAALIDPLGMTGVALEVTGSTLDEEWGNTLAEVGLTEIAPRAGQSPPNSIHDTGGEPVGLTRRGEIMGTPLYMAPEAWNGQDIGFTADVYSFGALMYELCAGRPPFEGKNINALWAAVETSAYVPLGQAAVQIEPRFASIIDQCLSRDPADRYPSAEWVRAALDELAKQADSPIPEGSPYRGLNVFEAKHRGVFYGRAREIHQLLDRLAVDSLVVVAGDSGTGKSSLCRAGVLPYVSQRLGRDRSWQMVNLVPGTHPLNALCACLAGALDHDEAELVVALEKDPCAFARFVRSDLGTDRGLVLFIDQFEELATIAKPAEAALVAEALSWLATRAPALRVLVTVRADYLGRVAELPLIGDAIARSLFFLRPLSDDRIREVIEGPARAKGYRFETEAMVKTLVASTVDAGSGGLPLLQFALGELWDRRDVRRNVIPAVALDDIGGVAGALSRYADEIIDGLNEAQAQRAQRVLTRLVTEEGTRARCTSEELLAGDPATAEIIELLINRRLLAQHEQTVEIAHEALVRGWTTLAGWLNADADLRMVRERLRRSVRTWLQEGRRQGWLWGADQLQHLKLLETEALSPEERTFLSASKRRRRRVRMLVVGALPLILLVGLGSYGGAQYNTAQEAARAIERLLGAGRVASRAGRHLFEEAKIHRSAALEAFDAGQGKQAEHIWAQWSKKISLARPQLATAARELETAHAWDREDRSVIKALVAVLTLRAEIARVSGQNDAFTEHVARLGLYDSTAAKRWERPAALTVAVLPESAQITVRAVLAGEKRHTLSRLPVSKLDALDPGAYVVEAVAPGHVRTRIAVHLDSGASEALSFRLPKIGAYPEGYVYVPPGRTPVGSHMPDALRTGFFRAVPFHMVETNGYLIGRHEVTVGEWIDYLDALQPAQRDQLLAGQGGGGGGFTGKVKLEPTESGWRYTLGVDGQTLRSDEADMVQYGEPGDPRPARAFPMRQMPLTSLSVARFSDYLQWLDTSGRLPGARLCQDNEWERAARAADNRAFPHGNTLDPDSANFDQTRQALTGPDAVGSHPTSVSPYGLHDMAGNVYEWVRCTHTGGLSVRSGAYNFSANTAQVAAAETMSDHGAVGTSMGFRICADFTPN
jgi:serine/threonine protein kinase/formylglycine-generating enzyme required for sulfatase activity